MSRDRPAPSIPWWVSIPGLFAQGLGMFLLPFAVGLVGAMFLEVSEVRETLPMLLLFFGLFVFPVSLAQVLGVILKSRREIKYWRAQRGLSLTRLLAVLYTHLRVVTLRGWIVLFIGLVFILLSLGLKWASFGLMAAVGLFLFYAVTGWTVFASTFLVHTLESSLERGRTGIRRQHVPAVALQGEPVEEVFTFSKVPIPWGYVLLVEDSNHPRLQTESRYALGSGSRRREVEARGLIRATPRGHYHLGPARLWYQDLLGITRVSVASVATSRMKVLPRFRPVEILEPPRTPQQAPDVVTRPHRYATEDHFRFREYAAGDDTRRIHWRLSLKSGTLQVRQPETREISTQDVILLLDSYLPPGKTLDAAAGADDILDALVDAWLGMARELLARGDRVTLVAALPGHDGTDVTVEVLPARKGQSARWQDMGARARWQGRFDLPDLLAEVGDDVHGVVVTGRFAAPPPALRAGQTLTWLFMDPEAALGPRERWWVFQVMGSTTLKFWLWPFILPHPAGSEENAMVRRLREAWLLRRLALARDTLRRLAARRGGAILQALLSRGDAVYRLERLPTRVRLVGLQGQLNAKQGGRR